MCCPRCMNGCGLCRECEQYLYPESQLTGYDYRLIVYALVLVILLLVFC